MKQINKMNSRSRIHNVIEYLKTQKSLTEIFDINDLEENPGYVLAYYELITEFTFREEQEIIEELRTVFEDAVTQEIIYQLNFEKDSLLI